MAQRSIRFGIGAANGSRAATWKLWTETGSGKSEVYLACRPLGGFLKASLHQSGMWHLAYTKQAFEEKVQGVASHPRDRFIDKWPRPREIDSGVTLAFRIVTPFSAVTATDGRPDNSRVIWLPNAPEAKATEIDILFTTPPVLTSGWPGRRSMGTSFIGSIPLNNGDTVWAVYWVVGMPDLSGLNKGAFRLVKGASKEDLRSGNLRALVFGSEPDGSRVMYDCVAKKGSECPESSRCRKPRERPHISVGSHKIG